MQFIIVIICLFIFLYSLYILGKDDYVLIRKNISVEQLFDFSFIGLLTGLILAKILAFVLNPVVGKNLVQQVFSPTGSGVILLGIILGYMIVLYLIGKYRRFPLGRLFDFFALSIISSISFGFLISVFFVNKHEIFYYLIPGFIYLGLQVFFWNFLFMRSSGNKLKDGSLACIFLMFFPLISFVLTKFYLYRKDAFYLIAEDYFLIIVFFISLFLLLKNEKKKITRGKK